MAMTREKRNSLIRLGGGAFLLGGLVLAGIKSFFAPISTSAASGDTPVVLVGGSLLFNAGDNNVLWWQDNRGFHVSPSYAIKSIVVKQKTNGSDDDNAGADKIRIDVSNATSWEVDVFIDSSPNSPIASITWPTPSSFGYGTNGILLAGVSGTGVSGNFCPAPAPTTTPVPPPPPTPPPQPYPTIYFGQQSGCSDFASISFSTVSITVNGQALPAATLNCIDLGDPKGTCRIVFRKN